MKRIATPAIGALLVLALTACGSGTPDGVTVEFWGLGREGEVVQGMIPEFERGNPGIEVEVQQIPWTAAHEKLITAHVGDATPDVAQLGNTWIPEFVALDALAPLDGLVAGSAAIYPDDYFAGIWATNTVDGVVYGIPWYVDTRVLFYRTDLLAAAGHERPPRTWEEWRAALRDLDEVLGEDGWPILLPADEWPQPVILGLQNGSTLLAEEGRYGAFSDPAFREAYEWYVGLFREGLAPPITSIQVANLHQQFGDGEFAMLISGPWDVGELRRRLPEDRQDDWSTAPLPGVDGPGVSMAGGSSLVVFADSEEKEAAWRLIEFLSAPERQVRFYELSGDLPARRAAWDDPVLAGDEKARAFREQLERVVPLPRVPEWERIATRLFQYGEAVVRRRLTVEQALAGLDRDVDRMLEKRRWILSRRDDRKEDPE